MPKSKATKELEDLFAYQVVQAGLPEPIREYKFHSANPTAYGEPRRRWQCDFAWPELRLIVEIEGGTDNPRNPGRHLRVTGFAGDCEKYNVAELYGWHVFRFTGKMVRTGAAIALITLFINNAPVTTTIRPRNVLKEYGLMLLEKFAPNETKERKSTRGRRNSTARNTK